MDILTIPHPILKTKCQEVTDFMNLDYFIDEMIKTAESHNLVGLAANQVNYLVRLFIMDVNSILPIEKNKAQVFNWQVFINPTIKYLKESGTTWDYEGCGSILNRQALIERTNKITITFQDIQGENQTLKLNGLLSRICQHEQDHLNGILLTDKKVRQWRFIK